MLPHGGAVTIGKKAGIIAVFKGCDFFFQLAMIPKGPADQAGSGRPRAVSASGLYRSLAKGRMLGQAEVVVG